MTYEAFAKQAREIFAAIPDDFRAGVDGLEVSRRTVTHPTLPEVFTLGECLSDFYPSEFGGAGEVRSRVALYYGSFLALSRDSDEWDWDDEIWETITHEIRHHLEHLASEDALEAMDFAEDQNFARREGESFDPLYYQSGEAVEPGVFAVDGDVFIEVQVKKWRAGEVLTVPVPLQSREFSVRLPDEIGDVHYLHVIDPPFAVAGDLFVVIRRSQGLVERVRGIVAREPARVLQTDVTALRPELDGGAGIPAR